MVLAWEGLTVVRLSGVYTEVPNAVEVL